MQRLLLLSQLFNTSIDDLVKGDAARIQQTVKQDSRKHPALGVVVKLVGGAAIGLLLAALLLALGG